MASSPVVAEPAVAPAASAPKPPIVPLLLTIVVVVFVCVGLLSGVMFYLVHSGKMSFGKAGGTEGKLEAPAVTLAHVMVLEPMIANLVDADGTAYLKVSLTLRIADAATKKNAPAKEEKPAKGMSDTEAAVRDTVLMVIGREASDQLLAPEGKERLKVALKVALAEHNPELKVMDLYFADFLVQR